MCLIADVETVRAMPAAIRERERPDRDRQRLERGGTAVARGLSCQHSGHIGLHRHRRHGVPAARLEHADTQGSWVRQRCLSGALDGPGIDAPTLAAGGPDSKDSEDRQEHSEFRRVHAVRPRKRAVSCHIVGRLAISW